MLTTDSLSKLDLSNDIIDLLTKNNLSSLKDIWLLKRKDLKQMGLNDTQIKQIIIRMQLNGIDLNSKIYDKNSSSRR